MRKRINLISLDTPPIKKNPYLLFLTDILTKYYDVSYWGLDKTEEYCNVTMFHINSIFLNFSKRILRQLSVLFLLLFKSRVVKLYSFTEIKKTATYIAEIIGNNVFLFAKLFHKTNHDDVFFVINAGSLLALSYLKKIRNIHYCYCIYEVYPFQYKDTKLLTMSMCLFEKIGIKDSDFVIDTGENKISVFINKIYKLKKVNVQNILIFPPLVVKYSREKTIYPVKFYYHGAYSTNRGLEDLIYAMKNIDVRKGRLYFRGMGDFREELEAIVKKCGVNDRVFFLKSVETERLSDAATDFDVGLTMVKMNVLNHKFAIGFKIMENMNAGLAIIAPNSYNLKPMLDKYKVGILYKDATIDELTRVMSYCIENLEWLDACKQVSKYCVKNIIGRRFQEDKLVQFVKILSTPNDII